MGMMNLEKAQEIDAKEEKEAERFRTEYSAVYYRKNNRGPLIEAEPGSVEAGYARDPKNHNKLTKL